MLSEFRPAVVLLLLMTALTGLAYPLAITGVAQVAFPFQAQGSLVERDGKVVGSALVGQAFASDRYFHPRPSATVGADPADAAKTIAVPYNAANSAGSNYGPTSKALIERMGEDVARRRAENAGASVPTDLVTASGSGLDPDISPDSASFQVPRVARARDIQESVLRRLVAAHTQERTLGFLGEARVNVLALNLALDALAGK